MPIGKRGGANPGERRGGRTKGTPNGATVRKRMAATRGIVAAERMRRSPLETILTVVAGGAEAEKITDRQFQAAVAAAPYCHARLAAVAYVPPPDDKQHRRRETLRQLSYQQLKAIEAILLSTQAAAGAPDGDGLEIDGKADENWGR